MEKQQLNQVQSGDGVSVGSNGQRGGWTGSGWKREASWRARPGFLDGKLAGGSFSSPKLELCFQMVHKAYVNAGKDVVGRDRRVFLCDVQGLFDAACQLERQVDVQPVIVPVKPDWKLTEKDPRVKAFLNRTP